MPDIPVHNPANINPALMTFKEYYDIVNPKGKSHPDTAYQTTLKKMNDASYNDISKYPILFRRVKINGIYFTIRLSMRKKSYFHADDIGLRKTNADGENIPYTDEEIENNKWPKHEYSIAVFNDENQCVGKSEDEWNCILVYVADEYKNFGLGTLIGKLARHFEPTKSSGGFTPSGYNNFTRVYREFVRDALRSGLYTRMVKSGKLTMDRVREIIQSAKLENKTKPANLNLSVDDTKDWLVLAEYGGFTLYDKKLKDVYIDYPNWSERFILGHVLVRFNESANGHNGILVQFGGETDKIKKFLMACAATYSENEGVPFWVDMDDMKYIDASHYEIGKENLATGFRRTKVKIKKPLNLKLIGAPDKLYRRSFDKYQEFYNTVLEIGNSKYRKVD